MTVINKRKNAVPYDPRRHVSGRNKLGIVGLVEPAGGGKWFELRRLYESWHLAEWCVREETRE